MSAALLPILDAGTLPARLNADPEFSLAARFWSGALTLGLDDARWTLRLEDGHVRSLARERESEVEEPRDIGIHASAADWEAMLEPEPRPFYHDIFAASIRQDVSLDGDIETFYAYYLAIRRLFAVMREQRADAGRA